jgi:AmiR/NasT family two-component response regulator
VIVLTGHDCPEFVDRAAELPVFNYLSKPAGVERLVPAIRLASARFLEWSALHGQVSELSRKMEERKLVERAKGILMEQRGLSEDEAYRQLRKLAMDQNKRLVEVAENLIAFAKLLKP